MEFVDQVLIRLGDDAERSLVFNDESLGTILSSAYDTNRLPVSGPYTAIYDEFVFGFTDLNLARLNGKANNYSTNDFVDITLNMSDFSASDSIFADILWRGSIVGRSSPSSSVIENVKMQWKSISKVDDLIIADLGTLPTDAATLELQRRAKLTELLKVGLNDPSIITDGFIDELIKVNHAKNISEFLAKQNEISPTTVGVTFSADPGLPPTPQIYPISAIVLICEQRFSVRETLKKSKFLRQRLDKSGIEKVDDKNLYPKQPLVVIWIVEESSFDDDEWPGGTPAMSAVEKRHARIQLTAEWLSKEGIGLVTAQKT